MPHTSVVHNIFMPNKICLFIQSPACGRAYVYAYLSAVVKSSVGAIFPVLHKRIVYTTCEPRKESAEASSRLKLFRKVAQISHWT